MLRPIAFLLLVTAIGGRRILSLMRPYNTSMTPSSGNSMTHPRVLFKNNRTVSFYAISDTPNTIHDMALFPLQIASLGKHVADFGIHLGGIQARTDHCASQGYSDMKLILNRSAVPMFIVPGENDYYHCSNRESAWKYWVTYLGGIHNNWNTPFLVRTHKIHPENFAFTHKSTLFIGLNILHPEFVNNAIEWETSERKNYKWIVQQVASFYDQVESVVIFAHAYPSQENYSSLWEELNDVAESLPDMPFLWLQGNGVEWTEDYPFRAKNVLRVVVDRGGQADPVLVTIDPEKNSNYPFVFLRRPLSHL